MATKEQVMDDEMAFGQAFDEGNAGPEPEVSPEDQEMTEDTAGLEEDVAGNDQAPVDVVIAVGAPQDAPAEEPPAEDPKADIEKERQRLRSWEGRLKAMEAKLKAMPAEPEESQTQEAIEEVAEDATDPELKEAAEGAADAVESGEMTPEQAMKMLADDFGDQFVRMIEVIVAAKAAEAGGGALQSRMDEVARSVDEVIADIRDSKTRAHFSAIKGAHPDFNEVGQSEAFKAWMGTQDEATQQAAANGAAEEVIALLDRFKAESQPADAPEPAEPGVEDTDEMDAAEGVRSAGGLQLPTAPAASEDYEAAWKALA